MWLSLKYKSEVDRELMSKISTGIELNESLYTQNYVKNWKVHGAQLVQSESERIRKDCGVPECDNVQQKKEAGEFLFVNLY